MLKSNKKTRFKWIKTAVFFLLSSSLYFIVLLIETITYEGFIKKHLLVSSRFVLFITLLFGTLYFWGHQKNRLVESKLIVKIISVFTLLTFLLFLYFGYLEEKNFPNYIFSKFHIIFINLCPLIAFGIFLTLWINVCKGYDFKIKNFIQLKLFNKIQYFMLFLILLISLYFVDNATLVLSQINRSFSFIISQPKASYEEKMAKYWGAPSKYLFKVRDITPERASILLPPQEVYWGITGNLGLVRYFLYPRSLTRGQAGFLTQGNFDFVVVSPGNELGNGSYKSWPDFKVDAETVFLIDPNLGEVHKNEGDYDPRNFPDNMWGLIQIE